MSRLSQFDSLFSHWMMPLPFFSLKALKGLVSDDATEVTASLSAELLGIDITEGMSCLSI